MIIGRLVYGPVDRNPDHFDLLPNEIVILNKSGLEIKRIAVDPINIEQASVPETEIRHELVEILDIDQDGNNEVLLNIQNEEFTDSKIIMMNSDLKDTLWINELIFDVEYEKHPDQYLHEYRPRVIKHDDIDHDGEIEIIATMDQQVHFQGHVWILDAKTGELEQSLKNTGWFLQIEMNDRECNLNSV